MPGRIFFATLLQARIRYQRRVYRRDDHTSKLTLVRCLHSKGTSCGDNFSLLINHGFDGEVMNGMVIGLTELTDATSCDLKRRIMIFLSQRGVSSLKRLSIEVQGGTVTFQGTVCSFYERQLCLCCQHVAGVLKLVDELKVRLPSSTTPPAPLNTCSLRLETGQSERVDVTH